MYKLNVLLLISDSSYLQIRDSDFNDIGILPLIYIDLWTMLVVELCNKIITELFIIESQTDQQM